MFGTASRPSHVNACRAVLLGGLAYCAASVRADNLYPAEAAPSKTVVVTAKRRSDPLADEQVRKHVERALHSDPSFYDEHIVITVTNGVVTLQGMVFDDWDLRVAKRISRRIPGVTRVINELEIKLGGE